MTFRVISSGACGHGEFLSLLQSPAQADSAALNVQLFQLQAGKDHGWADGGHCPHSSITASPCRWKCLRVASPPMRTAAISPCSTSGWAANAYDVAVADGGRHGCHRGRSGQSRRATRRERRYSVQCSASAVIGVPQAMEPISGTCVMAGSGSKPGGGQGVSRPKQIGRGGLQRGCQLFHLGLRQVVDAFFQLGKWRIWTDSPCAGQALPAKGPVLCGADADG